MPPSIIEQLWSDAGFAPNSAQLKAIEHVNGPLYLPAGPGSGKTRVLLWRTVNLIVTHGVHPDTIFLATFTEKASRQLREGMRAFLGAASNHTGHSYDVDRMYIGTVHSLCQRLIGERRLYPDFYFRRQPSLLDALAQYFRIYRTTHWDELLSGLPLGDSPIETINALFGNRRSPKSRHEAASSVISLFNRLSEECLEPAHWSDKDLDDCLPHLLDAYGRYLKILDGPPRSTDFSLLQQEALRAVQSYVGPALFSHVIIDEYQDTNTVQERLYFTLAAESRNLCVVGDDDQALYRFRGATVQNFVQFPQRCKDYLKVKPATVPLTVNYRSRRQIVKTYVDFMKWADWSKNGFPGGIAQRSGAPDYYRVEGKTVKANSNDKRTSVVASSPGNGQAVAVEIAGLCKRLLDEGVVANENQIAVLFPSLKGEQPKRLKAALESVGLSVYAPRASTFLEVDEATKMFGLYTHIFGKPQFGFVAGVGSHYGNYQVWVDSAHDIAADLMANDKALFEFIKGACREIKRVKADYDSLTCVADGRGWDMGAEYVPAKMKAVLASAPSLSEYAKNILSSKYLDLIVARRKDEGKPYKLSQIINRPTSLDWNALDLFYRFCGFSPFREMFNAAEDGSDEGPICNLGLISQYLARFNEMYGHVIGAYNLRDDKFRAMLFNGYLYALFRRGESEFEDAEDPFPRGRIPFLTVHQSKGLEFPVVILGSPDKRDFGPQPVERLIQPIIEREGEPLDRMFEFDTMRMFYVALSRAQNLLVLSNLKGQGLRQFPAMRALFDNSDLAMIRDLDVCTVPKAGLGQATMARNYSFTSDYLQFEMCPRQYMIFRKYGFEPACSSTMVFGTLVHRTIEDLHQLLMSRTKARG